MAEVHRTPLSAALSLSEYNLSLKIIVNVLRIDTDPFIMGGVESGMA